MSDFSMRLPNLHYLFQNTKLLLLLHKYVWIATTGTSSITKHYIQKWTNCQSKSHGQKIPLLVIGRYFIGVCSATWRHNLSMMTASRFYLQVSTIGSYRRRRCTRPAHWGGPLEDVAGVNCDDNAQTPLICLFESRNRGTISLIRMTILCSWVAACLNCDEAMCHFGGVLDSTGNKTTGFSCTLVSSSLC